MYKRYGHRGDATEEIVNNINYLYLIEKTAVVNKIPTPVKVTRYENGKILLGFFETQSTVDYHGAYNGIPICFDAKETNLSSFPLKNLHQHQVDYMNDFNKIGKGIAFILCHCSKNNTYYYMPIKLINKYWDAALSNLGRKSIPFKELEHYKIPIRDGLPDYLEMVKKEIEGGI